MILDLKSPPKMEPVVGMLYAALENNYHRLKSIITDMSQEELDYKGPNQKYNSTAQLIRHLAYIDLNWLYRIKGDSIPEELENKYGPMLDENNNIPLVYGVSLEKLLSDYDDVFYMIQSICYQLKDNQLNTTVNYEDGKEATIRWGIWHLADHNRYHQAHINQLRKWFKEEQDDK
ncbi:DinB family protein [Oceanobacillus sp. CFH 90083]|uniref:DinB family protein n=1 Tax=Oceanobacillus sp. CFH 90083 TaxID=2592336 RepID=UPI00188418F0|nr:DinB family protein [Oceanobacillus sp. CFH 90083]